MGPGPVSACFRFIIPAHAAVGALIKIGADFGLCRVPADSLAEDCKDHNNRDGRSVDNMAGNQAASASRGQRIIAVESGCR